GGVGLSIGLSYLLPVFDLPKPTGKFPVAHWDFEWVDRERAEWIDPWPHAKDQPRHIFLRVWYPTTLAAASRHDVGRFTFFPHHEFRAGPRARLFGVPSFLLGHFSHIKSHSLAPLSPDGAPLAVAPPHATFNRPLPLIIFSHGYQGAFDQNVHLCETLASHGYIVASPDFPGDATTAYLPYSKRAIPFNAEAPSTLTSIDQLRTLRNRHSDVRAKDLLFIISQFEALTNGTLSPSSTTGPTPSIFTSRIDTTSIGLIGHSFGGCTSIHTAHLLPSRIKAVIGLDAWTYPLPAIVRRNGINTPLLLFQAEGTDFFSSVDYGKENDKDCARMVEATAVNLSSSSSSPSLEKESKKATLLLINGAKHYDFSEAGLYAPLVLKALGAREKDARYMAKLVGTVALEWFGRFVKGEDDGKGKVVDGVVGEFTDVRVAI
ncbi:hypothetical protein HK104_000097, partial [Borealophlyctis nickersoniae]